MRAVSICVLWFESLPVGDTTSAAVVNMVDVNRMP